MIQLLVFIQRRREGRGEIKKITIQALLFADHLTPNFLNINCFFIICCNNANRKFVCENQDYGSQY